MDTVEPIEACRNEYKLIQGIIDESIADTWEEAKKEWELDYIELAVDNPDEEGETCLCGKNPIFNLCYIKNIHNKKIVLVGCICVDKFLGLAAVKVMNSIKAVCSNHSKSVIPELWGLVKEKRILNDNEVHFYWSIMDTPYKKLTERQLLWKATINTKILRSIIPAYTDAVKSIYGTGYSELPGKSTRQLLHIKTLLQTKYNDALYSLKKKHSWA